MTHTFRKKVHACIHPETYKYFVDPKKVDATWRFLEDHFGPAKCVEGFGILEMTSPAMLLRATQHRNPITVIRTSSCRKQDIDDLHGMLGFEPP